MNGFPKLIRGENAQELTVLECLRMLDKHGQRSMTIRFDNSPMLVRISLEFPQAPESKPS